MGRTKVVEILIIFSSFTYNVIRFWEYRMKNNDSQINDNELYESLLRLNSIYFNVYYTVLYLLSHFLILFLFILTLNIWITTKKSQRERCSFSSHQIKQHKTSRMIIIVALMFAKCNVLTFVLNIRESIKPNLFMIDWSGVAFILLDVSNICIMINS